MSLVRKWILLFYHMQFGGTVFSCGLSMLLNLYDTDEFQTTVYA